MSEAWQEPEAAKRTPYYERLSHWLWDARPLFRANGLGYLDFLVAQAIVARISMDKGYSWPSYEQIAEDIDVGRATVTRSVRNLTDSAIILVEETGRSNRYRLNVGLIRSWWEEHDKAQNDPDHSDPNQREHSDGSTGALRVITVSTQSAQADPLTLFNNTRKEPGERNPLHSPDDGSTDENKQVPVHQVAGDHAASPAVPEAPAEQPTSLTSPAPRPATPTTTPTAKQGTVLIDPGAASRSPRPAGRRSATTAKTEPPSPVSTARRFAIEVVNMMDLAPHRRDSAIEWRTILFTLALTSSDPAKPAPYTETDLRGLIDWSRTHRDVVRWEDYKAKEHFVTNIDNAVDAMKRSASPTRFSTSTNTPTWQQLAHAYGQDPEFKSCV